LFVEVRVTQEAIIANLPLDAPVEDELQATSSKPQASDD